MIVCRTPDNLPMNYDMLRSILFKTEFIILKAPDIENEIRMRELYKLYKYIFVYSF